MEAAYTSTTTFNWASLHFNYHYFARPKQAAKVVVVEGEACTTTTTSPTPKLKEVEDGRIN